MTTEISADAQRYAWLRDGKSEYGGYCGSAPFVVSPRALRLYAVNPLRAKQLDLDVDEDMLDSTVQRLHITNEVVERELLKYPVDRDSDEYTTALYLLAKQELGWTDERFNAVEERRNERERARMNSTV